MTANKKIPMRQCVGCNEMRAKKELIRVIKDSENQITLDATGRKNGRGAYVCKSMECLNKAMKNKGLERSLKMAVPTELFAELQKEMQTIETR